MSRRRIHAPGSEPTGAERARLSRQRRAAEGWRSITLDLPPAGVVALAALREPGETERAAVERALIAQAQQGCACVHQAEVGKDRT